MPLRVRRVFLFAIRDPPDEGLDCRFLVVLFVPVRGRGDALPFWIFQARLNRFLEFVPFIRLAAAIEDFDSPDMGYCIILYILKQFALLFFFSFIVLWVLCIPGMVWYGMVC